MRLATSLALALVIGLAGSANAVTIVHSSTLFDWVISDSVAVGDGSESLVAFTLSIVNNSGIANDNPQAFDSRASSLGGITGNLHQQHSTILSADTPTDQETNFATDIDTHFLLDGVNHAFDSGTGGPLENYVSLSSEAPNPPNPAFDAFADVEFGTFLTTTLTLTGAVGNTWDFAYVVVPGGSEVGVNGQAASTQGVKDDIVDFNFTAPPIPVPAALAPVMLGLGVLGTRTRRA